jgi:hypothetical protein
MRRHPHGASSRPPLPRPGNGYGRAARLGPPHQLRAFASKASKRVRDFNWLLAVSLDD